MGKHKLRSKEEIETIETGKRKIPDHITEEFYNLAVNYIENEFSVTPLIFKSPYLKGWQKLREEEVFSYDWYKGANGLGILCGEVNNIICLDIDIEDESSPILKELKTLLPTGIKSGKIGNPKRQPSRFFKYNGEENQKFHSLGVEILSTGSQTVLPGSYHKEYDKTYDLVGRALYDIDIEDLPDLPLDVIPWLRLKESEARKNANKNSTNASAYSDKTGASFILEKEPGRCAHNSYNVLSYFAVSLCKEGHNFEYVVAECLKKDATINRDSDYLLFECPTRKEFRNKTKVEACEYFVGKIFENHRPDYFDVRKILNEKQYRYFRPKIEKGFTYQRTDKDGNVTSTVRDHLTLYKYLKALHGAEYLPEAKSFAMWNSKYYELKPDDTIKLFAQEHFKNPECIKIGERNTFLDLVKNKKQGNVEDYTLKYNGHINFLNGAYSIKDRKLIKNDKSFKFPYVIPSPYVDDDNAPNWQKLLDAICCSKEHRINAIEEFIGYALFCSNYDKFNKILILDGGGSNGKSTLIRAIENIVGDKNCSSIDITKVGVERFAAFGMYNKLINFCSEVDPKLAFAKTGPLKAITGGDPVSIEEKHKGQFSAKLLAKFIISYNTMPFFPDSSEGMRRRIMLVKCEQNFDDNPHKKIPDIDSKIVLEKPQIITRCINAFHRVMDRGYFTELPDGMERFDAIVNKSNPIISFINEYIKHKPGNTVPISTLYDKFVDFQGTNSHWTKRGFTDSFVETANQMLKKRALKISDASDANFLGESHIARSRGSGGVRSIQGVILVSDLDV